MGALPCRLPLKPRDAGDTAQCPPTPAIASLPGFTPEAPQTWGAQLNQASKQASELALEFPTLLLLKSHSCQNRTPHPPGLLGRAGFCIFLRLLHDPRDKRSGARGRGAPLLATHQALEVGEVGQRAWAGQAARGPCYEGLSTPLARRPGLTTLRCTLCSKYVCTHVLRSTNQGLKNLDLVH